MLQRHAVEELHSDEGVTVLLADIVNCADVGVIQSRGGLGFALEAGKCLRVTRHFVWKKLQGDEAMQPGVLGFVDHAHPAADEFLNDAVMGDGVVDHQPQILRGRAGQVNESLGDSAIPQREAAKKRCPSVLLDLGIDEKTEEIRMTFCGPISGKEACRYSPERQERPGGGTEQRGRPKTVTRDQGDRLGEVISGRNAAVIKRAQRTWLVSLRAAAFRLSAKKAWKRL